VFSISFKRPLVTVTVVAGLLAGAASASAGTLVGNPGKEAPSGVACDGIGAVVGDRHAGFQCGGSNASSAVNLTRSSAPHR
jgi:hypothetical protein